MTAGDGRCKRSNTNAAGGSLPLAVAYKLELFSGNIARDDRPNVLTTATLRGIIVDDHTPKHRMTYTPHPTIISSHNLVAANTSSNFVDCSKQEPSRSP
jgi:hypothetical protein